MSFSRSFVSGLLALSCVLPVMAAKPTSIHKAKATQAKGTPTRDYFQAPALLVTVSSFNKDLKLLQHRQAVAKDYPLDKNPKKAMVVVGGELDVQLTDKRSFSGSRDSRVDLTGTTLDFYGTASPWALGYVSIEYDNGMGASTNNNRVLQNSNVLLSSAFITLGNLTKSPVYATIGQLSLPFGRYASYMVNSVVTKKLGQIKQRALVGGYARQDWSAQAYIYKGETDIGWSGLDEYGVNVAGQQSRGVWHWGYGGGYTSNIAESKQMQNNGKAGFAGFASTTETLSHRVPAWDLHTEISRGGLGVNLEYVAATKQFGQGDLDFNGTGAKPKALYAEVVCHPTIREQAVAVAFGYGRTQQALAIHLPKQSFAATLSTSWWQDTLFAVEARVDHNYSSSDTAAGGGSATFSPGKSKESSLTAQFSLYF